MAEILRAACPWSRQLRWLNRVLALNLAFVSTAVLWSSPTHAASEPVSRSPEQAGETSRRSQQVVPSEPEAVWLEVTLNGQLLNDTVIALRLADGTLLLAGEDLRRWRLDPPSAMAESHDARQYFALAQLGIEAVVDSRNLRLVLEAPAGLFAETSLDAMENRSGPATRSTPGAFLNYDISASGLNDDIHSKGLFELGLFNSLGSGTSAFLARDDDSRWPSVVRLDTTWRRDDPAAMRSLLVGDTHSNGTGWSGATRFAGLQWGSNFSTNPEFITTPFLALSGEAELTSTLDLYVNEALKLQREVPPGPFSIRDIPVVNGQGETRLVVRDALGREQVYTQQYYASPRLLRQGLREYSLELGFLRENYGLASNDYEELMAAATLRSGINDNFTLETHGQLTRDQLMAGAGGAWLLPWQVTSNVALAVSRKGGETGQLTVLGVEHQGPYFSAGIEGRLASEHFVRLGAGGTGDDLPTRQFRTFGRLSSNKGGSFSLSYTEQQYEARQDVEFFSAAYNIDLAGFGYLSLSALHFPNQGSSSLSLHFTLPLNSSKTTGSISATRDTDGTGNGSIQFQRSLPPGSGFGYRVRAGRGNSRQHQGSLSYQNDYGRWRMEAATNRGQTGIRADAEGSLTLMGGGVYAGRSLTDSFALVQVADIPGVRIYADNQQVARTNSHGNAIVPRLRAYERNRLSIEQADLPLGVRVNTLEQEVIPHFQSGVSVEFPVDQSRDAFFRIVLEDGQPLAIGAIVELKNGRRFPVGRRGEVYLTGLQFRNDLQVLWQGQRCSITLDVAQSDVPLLDLGTFICRGITPPQIPNP